MSTHRWYRLVKPKHKLVPRGGQKWSLQRAHDGFYEDRDVQGTFVHWEWLLAKWTAVADKLEALEKRGVL